MGEPLARGIFVTGTDTGVGKTVVTASLVAELRRLDLARKHFEPGGEIHRRIDRRDADIAEIARAVARRDVHAAAQRDGQVRVVAAHALPGDEGVDFRVLRMACPAGQ